MRVCLNPESMLEGHPIYIAASDNMGLTKLFKVADGIQLDKLVLTLDETYQPEGSGLHVSQRK